MTIILNKVGQAESGDDRNIEGGLDALSNIKAYSDNLKAEKLAELDNYSVLKDYGIDTTQAGDLVTLFRTSDG